MILLLIVTLYPFLNVLAISLNESTDTVKGGIHIFQENLHCKIIKKYLKVK